MIYNRITGIDTLTQSIHVNEHTRTYLRMCICLFQNGYPSRRRSLVDDARFETLVVKQTKQSVLEEARARANGEDQ